jgi:erythromycin esterase-like protein
MLRRPLFNWCLLLGVLLLTQSPQAAAIPFETALDAAAHELAENGAGLPRLLEAAGEARVVLLGEASHGTHEFYTWRDSVSRRLIEAGRVAFVAIEGDSATLAPLDRYVRHAADAPVSAHAALAGVTHWPSWVWANAELAAFAEWLRRYNERRPADEQVAIHGLDLYAISAALDAVEAFYRRWAPGAMAPVRQLRQQFLPFAVRPGVYADVVRTTGLGLRPQALSIVHDLEVRYRQSPRADREAVFLALQQARAVAAGLGYLEALPRPPVASANWRSRHFSVTLDRLLAHYGDGRRGIVWAHNTHVGDARATDGRAAGKLSLGQLARAGLGKDAVFIVGFGTGVGEVLAARHWGGACEVLPTPPPRPDSLEAAMLGSGAGDRLWLFPPGAPATRLLARWIAHRAIGTTYDPAREPIENYVPTITPARYDAFVFLPETRALQALDWPSGEARCMRGDTE